MLRAGLSLSKQHFLPKTSGGLFLFCFYAYNQGLKIGPFKTFTLNHQYFSIKKTYPFFLSDTLL